MSEHAPERITDKWRTIASSADLMAFSENTSLFDDAIRALETAADLHDALQQRYEAVFAILRAHGKGESDGE